MMYMHYANEGIESVRNVFKRLTQTLNKSIKFIH